jgi:hypothetical protein
VEPDAMNGLGGGRFPACAKPSSRPLVTRTQLLRKMLRRWNFWWQKLSGGVTGRRQGILKGGHGFKRNRRVRKCLSVRSAN